MVSLNAENLLAMNFSSPNVRIYRKNRCVFFRRTKDDWGGFSNMAGGYKVVVDGTTILTSEALYQACRFPHIPEIQKLIIEQKSPMTAKMVGKPYRSDTRPDWFKVRIEIMRWCLKVKLINNIQKFTNLLIETESLPIVEWSTKDDFWGAKLYEDKYFIGTNALGRLLMELREELKIKKETVTKKIEPLNIEKFDLLGIPIMTQYCSEDKPSNSSTIISKDNQLNLLD